MMPFFSTVSYCLQAGYANFDGRSSNSQFWYFMVFYIGGLMVTAGIGFSLVYWGIDANFSKELLQIFMFGPFVVFAAAIQVPFLRFVPSAFMTLIFLVCGN